jgi:hypothetical protein
MFRLVNVTALVVGGLYVSYAIHDAGHYFFANVLFTAFLAVAILSIGATKN